MGGGQSSERSSHFQNENVRDDLDSDIDEKSHHISISNKMVERLVEDATVAGSVAAAAAVSSLNHNKPIREAHETLADAKDRALSERLKSLDESHSEKIGLTIEDLKASVKRIELRTANMMSLEPVCRDCAEKLINCYDTYIENSAHCSDIVRAFTECVQESGVTRLHARTAQEAMEAARRTRHVARARHHALKDISLPPQEVPS